MMLKGWKIFARLLLFGFSALALAQDLTYVHRLNYDHQLPLDVKDVHVELRPGVTIHDISYASPKGGRVPAYMVVPNGTGPFAAVLWGHWYWTNSTFCNRKEFLEEAVVLGRAGVVSLLVDGPIARPGYIRDKDPLSDREQDYLVQAIVDMRRGADLLLARKDVDPLRLAYVGHSYDATVGAFLVGIDHRFKCFVLMAGNLSDEIDLRSQEMQEFRARVGPARFDAYMAKWAWLDPGNFVPYSAPATILLQYGSRDDLPVQSARQYAETLRGPKRLEIYDAPHALNSSARKDRVAFLRQQLDLPPIPAAAVAAVPELPQPARPEE